MIKDKYRHSYSRGGKFPSLEWWQAKPDGVVRLLRGILAVCLFALLLSACGYQIVGLERASGYRYYIAEVLNNSDDYTITDMVEGTVTRFFSDYDAIQRDRARADYILKIALTDIPVTSAITSSTREALSSTMRVTYLITVEDRQGKVLYSKPKSYSMIFEAGESAADYSRNEMEAFEECTDSVLSGFKYEFEQLR